MLCITLLFVVWVSTIFSGVASHGFVHTVVINGQEYPGWNPFSDPYIISPPKAVRKVLNDGFVAATDPDLPCHHGGNDGTGLVADVTAGSQVTFRWSYVSGCEIVPHRGRTGHWNAQRIFKSSQWPGDHQGPVSTYMASCNGDCTTFSAGNARWFKLDAAGYEPATRQWAADKLRANDNSWISTIPAGLAPGQYLMRHEIYLNLKRSAPLNHAAVLPELLVKVSGSGTGQPSENDLVSIPGLYSNVGWPNIYSDFGTFLVPGPAPVTFGVGGNPPPITPTVTSARPTPTAGTTQASNTSTTTTPASGHCLLHSRRLIRRTSK